MKKKKKDENEIAFDIVSKAAQSNLEERSSTLLASDAARMLSKLGAHLGGRARALSLSKARRKEIAQKAANARWSK
jgi:hypothetical protein